MISVEEAGKLFCNVTDIVNCAQSMLNDLKAEKEKSHDEDDVAVGRFFRFIYSFLFFIIFYLKKFFFHLFFLFLIINLLLIY